MLGQSTEVDLIQPHPSDFWASWLTRRCYCKSLTARKSSHPLRLFVPVPVPVPATRADSSGYQHRLPREYRIFR
ncbi:uncharacterized protein RSE6_07136 [Rhynchosporium secalis]|uniref:Uncharacterized protein n=1 Tax=Rhynchosporium secalis TaxID=38038 RepID=A0A1E1MCB8_RHYSE|nr:uncharacterized protein RSE6_07136 [Rhynchosporium secalis]